MSQPELPPGDDDTEADAVPKDLFVYELNDGSAVFHGDGMDAWIEFSDPALNLDDCR